MIVIVIGVLAALVVAALVWARIASARSESRSVETYEHALDVLGEVSKRTESAAFRILPHEETGRPHVGRPLEERGDVPPPRRPGARPSSPGPLASQRLPPAGQPKFRFSQPGRPGGGETAGAQPTGDAGHEAAERGSQVGPAGGAGAEERSTPVRRGRLTTGAPASRGGAHQPSFHRRRQVMTRRVATGGAGAVAVAAVAVAAILLSGGRGHPPKTTSTTLHRSTGGSTTTTTLRTTTTIPTSIKPTSVTSSDVSFAVPSGKYTLSFQAVGGACWVGIEQTTAGPWLFSQTLNSGQSATYKGSGSLVVRLGAPVHIGLDVNGLVAKLPNGYSQPFNVDLAPSSA